MSCCSLGLRQLFFILSYLFFPLLFLFLRPPLQRQLFIPTGHHLKKALHSFFSLFLEQLPVNHSALLPVESFVAFVELPAFRR